MSPAVSTTALAVLIRDVLLPALLESRTGLDWYRDLVPDQEGRGDAEVLARIDSAIAAAEALHPTGESKSAVSFVAELIGAGDANALADSLGEFGNQPVLIFTALINEVRKAGPLFRKEMRFTAIEAGR